MSKIFKKCTGATELQKFIFMLVAILEEVRHIILIKATDVGNRIQTDRGPFVPKSNALTTRSRFLGP